MQDTKKHISAQFIGLNSKVVVQPGRSVNQGTVIAVNEDDTKIYSTCSGVVKKVTSNSILIEQTIIVKKKEDPKEIEVPKPKKIANVDALDGLRTLAIVGVMLYHLNFGWLKGGLIGVTMFFVLSGYLITGLIAKEIETTSKFNLKRFWIHRIRRLFPAIAIVVIIVALSCVLFNHLLLTKMKPDIIPALIWMENWWYIIRDLSYFEAIGDPSPLVHFWSLAIEEQFYLVWPLLLLGAYKIGAKQKFIRRGCLVLATLSAIAMALIYNPNADPTRVYYGTDTRAFSLLIGAWLAYVWPWQRFNEPSNKLEKEHSKWFDIVGVIAILTIIVIMIVVDGMSPAMYYGILFLVSILTAVIIAVIVNPDSQVARIFAFKPISWVGKRSYGMYLWHFPLILLLKPIVNDNTNTWWFALLIFALTIGISALSYKFIENPIRRGAIGKWYADFKKRKYKPKVKEIIIAVICAAAIVGTTIAVIATPDETYVPEEAIQSTGDDAGHAMYVEGQYYPLLIADSVAGEIKIKNCFPYGLNDSVVGRWTNQAVTVLQEYAQRGTLGNVVVVDCFSNHLIGNGDLDKMLEIVGPNRELFFVNSYLHHQTCVENNETLKKFQEAHSKNVHIIDWYKAVSVNEDRYLYKDHVHPNIEGQILYVRIMADAINPYLPDKAKCDVNKIEQNIRK